MRSPGNRESVSLRQACHEYGTYEQVLYELELRPDDPLIGVRVGNRVWYSRAQLTELLGEPKHRTTPPALKRRDNRSADTGGNQERFPFAREPLAA